MAEFDWMSSEGFRDQITKRVSAVAGGAGLTQYERGVPESIFRQIQERRPLNESREMVKSAGLRRTEQDALASVEALVKRAAEIAKAEKREVLTEADYQTAFKEKFCTVWPVC